MKKWCLVFHISLSALTQLGLAAMAFDHLSRRFSTRTQPTTTILQSFVQDYLGYPVSEETFTHSHLSWSSTVLYQLFPSSMIRCILPVHFMCLIAFLHNLCPKSSLVYLLVWNSPLHTPYISSLSNCLLFATHAYTIRTCFAVIYSWYLSQLSLELYLLP